MVQRLQEWRHLLFGMLRSGISLTASCSQAPDSRGGGWSLPLLPWSLLLLLRYSNLSSFLCSSVTTPLSVPASYLAMSSSLSAWVATAALLLI